MAPHGAGAWERFRSCVAFWLAIRAASVLVVHTPGPLGDDASDRGPRSRRSWQLETWELYREEAAKEMGRGQRDQRRGPVPELVESMMNLTKPGMCYASPIAKVFNTNANAKRIEVDFHRGKERAADMKILFVGLVRNAESAVWRSYQALREVGLLFKDYHFFVLENDSDDNTGKKMKRVASQDPRYEFASSTFNLSFEHGLEPTRMARMARLRNSVRKWVESFFSKHPSWKDSLIAMYDFDLNLFHKRSFAPHALFVSLGREAEWDMMCANGLHSIGGTTGVPRKDAIHLQKNLPPRLLPLSGNEFGLHDCFAFRNSKFHTFNSACQKGLDQVLFGQYDLVEVASCFGGLAMYKPQKFLQCKYDESEPDCEHVPFHMCMRSSGSRGRMFMDPLLTTRYGRGIDLECSVELGNA